MDASSSNLTDKISSNQQQLEILKNQLLQNSSLLSTLRNDVANADTRITKSIVTPTTIIRSARKHKNIMADSKMSKKDKEDQLKKIKADQLQEIDKFLEGTDDITDEDLKLLEEIEKKRQ